MSMQLVLVIAPNASEQMGGEAMKALQIYREFKALRPNTVLITHARNRDELHGRLGMTDVVLIPDDLLSVAIWRSVVFRPVLDYWFFRNAVKAAEAIAASAGLPGREVVIYQAEPNSPVLPRILAKGFVNTFGPVNGNIYYPKLFRAHEALWPRMRRLFHFPLQRINRVLPRGIKAAQLVLTAGGRRTRDSLLAAGCPPQILLDCIDCGIAEALLQRPRIAHEGRNLRFVHFGRLVFHKGTFLIIKSLAKTKTPVRLDIIGKGPELERCRALAAALSLQDRITFLQPYRDQAALFDSLAHYRGMVLPSFEDANGMVVQEAMALGLPSICLDWGGPQLLVEHGRSGYLVEPDSEEQITSDIAGHLDALAQDARLAEGFSVAGRARAVEWGWPNVAARWLEAFGRLRA